MKKTLVIIAFLFVAKCLKSQNSDSLFNFVFLSDVHFGLTKKEFRGKQDVDAYEVNKALVQSLQKLQSNQEIGPVESIIVTGDIANRMETGIQSAKVSWNQFLNIYRDSLSLYKSNHLKSDLWVMPGNHDMSNAIGFHRKMNPIKDPSAMVGIYNLVNGTHLLSNQFDSTKHRIHYSKEIAGVHFVFLSLFLDSAERVWLDNDLSSVNDKTPVLLYAHSIPDVEARFFQNPNGIHDINEDDKFENLTPEMFKDGKDVKLEAIIEQQGFANYIKKHPNIKAYFHGHENYTEYYLYQGPDNDIHLPCIRVDSPMKGRLSAKDESKLAYEILTINKNTGKMVIKECLWNDEKRAGHFSWGQQFELSLW